MKAYKGFDKNLKCRNFQYEVEKEYEESKADLCNSGFHACINPVDVYAYYPPNTSRYCEVELHNLDNKEEQDSKICGRKIKIIRELTHKEYLKVCFDLKSKKIKQSSGYREHAQSSGNYGQAQSSGRGGHAQSSGNYGHAQSSGNYGHAQSSGRGGHAQSSGNYGHAQSSGDDAHAQSSGRGGHAQSSGGGGHAQSSGDGGHAQSSGDEGHARSSGDGGHAQSSGDDGHAQSSGKNSSSHTTGINSTIMLSENSKFCAMNYYDDNNNLIGIAVGEVGKNIEKDIKYRVNSEGIFVEIDK